MIPSSFPSGETIRLAVTLDSAQAFAPTDTAAAGTNQSENAAATQAEPKSELKIVVKDTIFSDLVCLWNKITKK